MGITGLLLGLAGSPAFAADDLSALLARGEVNLLETYADGRLKQVTTMALVAAPIDVVWRTLIDFESYDAWMPQVSRSDVAGRDGDAILVDWAISVVGPDVTYRGRYVLDPAAYTIKGTWVSGGMPGSTWNWRLEAVAGGTVMHRVIRVNVVDSNWVLKQIDDQDHTLDYGLNSAVGVVEVRGVKKKLSGG